MLLRRAVRRHRSNGQTLPRIREHLCTCTHVHKCGIGAYPALKTARLFAYIPRRRKPNKMSAFGTLHPLLTRPPRGLLTPWGFAPHPTFATWQGCRRRLRLNTCTPTTDRWVASDQSRPWPLRGCCASLDSSPAPFVLTGFLGSSKLISKILRISDMSF